MSCHVCDTDTVRITHSITPRTNFEADFVNNVESANQPPIDVSFYIYISTRYFQNSQFCRVRPPFKNTVWKIRWEIRPRRCVMLCVRGSIMSDSPRRAPYVAQIEIDSVRRSCGQVQQYSIITRATAHKCVECCAGIRWSFTTSQWL